MGLIQSASWHKSGSHIVCGVASSYMYYNNRDTSSESHKQPGLPHHQHASPPWTASQPASVVANRSRGGTGLVQFTQCD